MYCLKVDPMSWESSSHARLCLQSCPPSPSSLYRFEDFVAPFFVHFPSLKLVFGALFLASLYLFEAFFAFDVLLQQSSLPSFPFNDHPFVLFPVYPFYFVQPQLIV